MSNYICDCGRVFTDPDGPIMCADHHHGKPISDACKGICATCSRLDKPNQCIMTMDLLNKAQGLGVTGIGCSYWE